ncbi:MAG: efflux RND transporter periplasmic adaptor subunit [Gemmatimonadaceae bacterium]|nr:efflux RND transporter periplasmic adaptor subunit [Gemmatimonadaceae bacterium]
MLLTRRLLPLATLAGVLAFAAACDKTAAAGGDGAAADSTAADTASTGGSSSTVSLPVVADEAIDADLVLTVNTTGQVRSDAEGRLRAEVGGPVEKVMVRPGDRVKKGQVLAQLDLRQFDLEVDEAQVAVDVAMLTHQENYRPDSMATGQLPPQARLDASVIRSGLAAARVRLDRAKLNRERATFVAPFDGVVDRVLIVPGDRISAGAEVTTIVDLVNLRIEAAVLEHDLPLIKVGGEAVITSAAMAGKSFSGKVQALLTLVDSTTRSGRAFVRASGNSGLRPGMYADVRLEAQRLPNRRLVPTRAIIERDGRPLVFVIKNGRAQWTYILPGRSNGRQTEVLPDSVSGIIPVNPGDQVIVEGHLTLTHDAPVRVVAKREAGTGGQD